MLSSSDLSLQHEQPANITPSVVDRLSSVSMDPLGITASSIAIVTFAAQVSKGLYDVITGIQEAPKTLRDIGSDLRELSNVLDSLKQLIEPPANTGASAALQEYLSTTKPAIEECSASCEEFKVRLVKMTSHSTPDRTSFRDKVKLQFEEKELAGFRYLLSSYKATISLGLNFATLKSNAKTATTLSQFEDNVSKALEGINGQIQGLTIGMQAVKSFDVQKDELVESIQKQISGLASCVRACLSTLSSTAKSTGNQVKYARALGDAQQLVGVIGNIRPDGPVATIDVMIAEQNAQQMGGVISGDVALEFMRRK